MPKSKYNYSNYKKIRNRAYNEDYINYIEKGLKSREFNDKQIQVILGTILEESGGDPYAVGPGGFAGLIQWAPNRYIIKDKKDAYKELDNQLDYLKESLDSKDTKLSWNHGGKGSGFNTALDARKGWLDENSSIEDLNRAFNYGYVRPYGNKNDFDNKRRSEAVNNRLIATKSLLSNLKEIGNNKIINDEYSMFFNPNKVNNNMRNNDFGLGLIRRKYAVGGITAPGYTSYGSPVSSSDISEEQYSADGEGIVGSEVLSNAGTFAGLGLGAGALATTLGASAIAGPIGLAAGLLFGGLFGLFGGNRKKRAEERRRQEQLRHQYEMNRQAIVGNMETKEENDIRNIRQEVLQDQDEGIGLYAKFGGLVGRRRLKTGGQVIPNSNNTSVAYGQTHEQINLLTGETGINYGDAEIEGGGVIGNKAYAGEVVRQTPDGDQIFSDSLYIPGTKITFAEYAKKLTDDKGRKDSSAERYNKLIDLGLEALTKSKLNKLKTGDNIRNIEKLTNKFNKAVGQAEIIDEDVNNLFNIQELYANMLGLRNQENMKRFGGFARRKYATGGYNSINPIITWNDNIQAPSSLTSNISESWIKDKQRSVNRLANSKFGFNEMGLTLNLVNSLTGIIGNSLAARRREKAIEWEMKQSVPKHAKVEAETYDTSYNINNELQELASRERRAAQFIKNNSSNPIVARNNIAFLGINAQEARNKLYSQKNQYQKQRYDMNINSRVRANNINKMLDYEDQMNQYNKMVQLNAALAKAGDIRTQGYMTGIDNITGSLFNYMSGNMMSIPWANGVQNLMRNNISPFGNRMAKCGGMIRKVRR